MLLHFKTRVLKGDWCENRGHMSDFLTFCKNYGRSGRNVWAIFSCKTWDPTTDICSTGHQWAVWEIRVWM